MEIEELVEHLNLQPHLEGGFYCETYRSEGLIPQDALPRIYNGHRNYSTGIYFLLVSGNFSAFHRINQDEMWHHYFGGSINIHVISPDGNYSKVILGKDFTSGEMPQAVVRGGSWFASEVTSGHDFGLAGCTVAPGFDFSDFELPNRDVLLKRFPQHERIILKFTRK